MGLQVKNVGSVFVNGDEEMLRKVFSYGFKMDGILFHGPYFCWFCLFFFVKYIGGMYKGKECDNTCFCRQI